MYTGAKIIRDGLILQYDVANNKCFRGEPTSNVFYLNGFNPLDIYTWANTGYQMTLSRDLSIKSPLGGVVLKILTNGNSAYVNSYYSNYYNLSVASSGQTWTFSYYFKASAGASVGGYIMGVDVEGHYVDLLNVVTTATGNWQRYSHTYTFTNANVVAIQTRIDIYTAYATVYIDAVQIEEKDHATPFTPTSRGTTVATGGGLIDLSNNGNNGEIVNNILYDSNNCGSLKFDAISAYITINNDNITSITNGTISFWSKMDDNSNWLFMTGPNTSYYILAADSGNPFYHSNIGNNVLINYIDGLVNNSPPIDLGWHHITLTGVNLSTWTVFKMGMYVETIFKYNGKMSNIMFYNRVLSQSEIQQNYNATKTRYL